MNLIFQAICTYLFVIELVVSEEIAADCSVDGNCKIKNESTHGSLNLYSKGEWALAVNWRFLICLF